MMRPDRPGGLRFLAEASRARSEALINFGIKVADWFLISASLRVR